MKILMVTSESVPFSKSGGLADVVGALTPALIEKGNDARIILPAYNTPVKDCGEEICKFEIKMLSDIHSVSIRMKTHNNVKYYFVCHPFFNERLGIYGDTSFEPYSDNFERFTLLCLSTIEFCKISGFMPDIIHCHDWTTGLLPYLINEGNSKDFMNTKTVFTIHNLAYQGTFARMDFLLCGRTPAKELFHNNQLNMLKSGLVYSDFITTVSPTYAKEIQNSEQGCNLDSILVERSKYLRGILNGIDTQEWNPQEDKLLKNHFSSKDLSGKALLKEELQKKLGLEVKPGVPVFAMISRLASQKGFDALLPVLEEILTENNLQFVILGTGDARISSKLLEFAEKHKNLSVNIAFSNPLAHLVEAASDFFLMPSRYEPCGLNQMYSLHYGTLPIVRRTGGLADTVRDLDDNPDNGNGFVFNELTPSNVKNSVQRALKLYSTGNMSHIVSNAMEEDFSWGRSADMYLEIFNSLIKEK